VSFAAAKTITFTAMQCITQELLQELKNMYIKDASQKNYPQGNDAVGEWPAELPEQVRRAATEHRIPYSAPSSWTQSGGGNAHCAALLDACLAVPAFRPAAASKLFGMQQVRQGFVGILVHKPCNSYLFSNCSQFIICLPSSLPSY
jgi:hypothetical protein